MDNRYFFDELAQRWDEIERPDIAPKLARVISEAGVREGDRVLDVGTGTGILIPFILEAVGTAGKVTAIDPSPKMLAAAAQKRFPPNVEFIEAGMEECGLPDQSFDRVICNAVFPHFSDEGRALAEAFRLLVPGGVLMISHPIGREAVNDLHRNAGDVVAEDRVPAPEVMAELLRQAGFTEVRITDEPDYFSAVARKPVP